MILIKDRLRRQVKRAILQKMLVGACVCCALLSVIPMLTPTAQAAVPVVTTLKEKFSSFEVAMDKFADQYGRDNLQVLAQLQSIEKEAVNLKDFATLSAYRCYLMTQLKQTSAYQTVLAELKNKLPENSLKPTVQAAIELC